MSDKPQLDIYQKIDKTAECVKTGDVKCVEEVINSVQQQKAFLNSVAGKVESAYLPGLKIDRVDGYADSLKVTGGKHPLTLALDHKNGDKLTITDDRTGLLKSLSDMGDSIKQGWNDSKKAVKETIDSLPPFEDIKRANTPDSDLNRRWQAQERKEGI